MALEINLVEAIEEGKIVKVSEDYARREGLPILRKSPDEEVFEEKQTEEKVSKDDFENKLYGVSSFRKPLDWRKQQVVSGLIDNFHWHIARARRHKDLSRKQVADAVGVTETEIKMLENGMLPDNGFSLVNRIQDLLKINLRKDNQDFSQPMRKLIDSKLKSRRMKQETIKNDFELMGSDVEIVEE